jgi:hypothetical protein
MVGANATQEQAQRHAAPLADLAPDAIKFRIEQSGLKPVNRRGVSAPIGELSD